MTETKHLNLHTLNRIDGQHKDQKEVHLKVAYKGKEETVSLYIDEIFRPSKIRECVEEFINKMGHLKKYNNISVQEVGEAYLVFILIKHFTSFPAPDKIEEQVKVIQMLIDNSLIYQIYAKFKAEELEKVQEQVRLFAEEIDENAEMYVGLAEEMGFKSEEE